jgi:hypothetical protein
MARSVARWWDARRSVAWVALAWTVLGVLGGCAAGAHDPSSSHDIVTESDEPARGCGWSWPSATSRKARPASPSTS